MRARANFAIDALAIVLYVVATNPASTGTPVHEWVGVCVAFVAFVHLASHWSWTVRTVKRLLGVAGRMPRVNLLVDTTLLVAFVTVVMSGLLVSRSALKPLGWLVPENSVWHAVHSQSATVLLVLMGVHLGLHWGWIASALRHRIFRPMLHPVGTFVHLRDRAVEGWRLDWRGARDSIGAACRHTAEAALLIAILAACVFGLATRTNGPLLATWLTMPGGSGTGLSANVRTAQTAGLSAAGVTNPGDTAESQLVSPATRAVIRSAHAFLLLGVAMLAAMGLGDALKPART